MKGEIMIFWCPTCRKPCKGERGTPILCEKCKTEFVLPAVKNGVEGTPEGWRVECEWAVYHAGTLLKLSGLKSPSSPSIVEMILTAPRSVEEANAKMGDCSLFSRSVRNAFVEKADDPQLIAAGDYFIDHLAAMKPEDRAMLDASIAGVFMGWMMY
jgi:hypothetical protein